MAKIIALLIWALASFGLYGTLGLVSKEITKGDICPKIIGIPACYIILVSFLMVLMSHSTLLKDTYWGYFIGAGVAWAIATTGTVGQLMGTIECPKTATGIPMCYLSLAFFSTLLVFKLIEIKVS